MSQRFRNENVVSLFPFLAVLLCAMGALLFLLVITTRMMRDDAQKQAVKQSPIVVPEPVPVVFETEIALGQGMSFPQPPVPDAPALIAPKPVFVTRELPPSPPDLSAELARLKSQIRQQQQLTEAQETQYARMAQSRQDQLAEIAKREAILDNAQQLTAKMQLQQSESVREIASLQQDSRKLSNEIQTLRAKVRDEESKPRTSPNALKIVPYEGNAGTTRRPILIECTAEGLKFVPEDVLLGEPDLVGFPVEANPILAGVKTLEQYWSRVDGVVTRQQRPYVLLVVRPDGIPAYYAARQLLQTYDQPFGYELLGTDQELALAESDPNAAGLLKQAVSTLIAQRGNNYDPGNSPFPDANGNPQRGTGTGQSETAGVPNSGDPRNGSGGRPRGGYRFKQTPRGLELVRDDGAPADLPPRTVMNQNRGSERPTNTPSEAPVNPRYVDVAPQQQTSEAPKLNSSSPTQKERVQSAASAGTNPFDPNMVANGAPPSEGSPAELGQQFADARRERQNQSGENSAAATIFPPDLIGAAKTGGRSKAGSPGQIGGPKLSFKRELTVVISPDQVQIGEAEAVSLTEGVSTEQIMSLVVSGLREEVGYWGSPPEQFQWKPQVHFVIEPGGLMHFERIRPLFEREKLISDVDFRFASALGEEAIR